MIKCPTCHGELVQKNRTLLLGVGGAMIASISLVVLSKYFLILALILVPIGGYLLIWATRGKSLWCRNCKKFSLF
jgi:hypothetical protein